MSHLDLTTTSQSIAGASAARSFAMVTTDKNTVVHILAADGTGVTDTTACAFVTELTYKNPSINVTDGSTNLLYALKGGTAPSAIWCDAPTSNAVPVAGAATSGAVQLSVAPASPATPIAVGTLDPRVITKIVPVTLSATDGSLAETPIHVPGVAGAVSAVKIVAPAAITQSDTDYLTFTVKTRDGAGGAASSVASTTTKSTAGTAFTAFQAVSLGALSNATTTATTVLTFLSAKSGAGQAVAVPILLEITVTPS